MQAAIELLRITRANILKIVERYSLEQLNHIPTGFNNNLAWNFGHTIIAQQLLCYRLSNLPALVSNDLIEAYRKGSKPEGPVTASRIDDFKALSSSTIVQLEKDYSSGIFKEYKSYTTSYGVTLGSIEDAIRFNNIHEGMHLGTMIALTKLV